MAFLPRAIKDAFGSSHERNGGNASPTEGDNVVISNPMSFSHDMHFNVDADGGMQVQVAAEKEISRLTGELVQSNEKIKHLQERLTHFVDVSTFIVSTHCGRSCCIGSDVSCSGRGTFV